MKKNNRKGFTIVELVIVIAVIGILAAVLIPTFSGIIDDAKETAAIQDARSAYTQYLATTYENNGTPVTTLYVKHDNGKYVKITNGEAVITTDATKTPLYKIENGTLVTTNE